MVLRWKCDEGALGIQDGTLMQAIITHTPRQGTVCGRQNYSRQLKSVKGSSQGSTEGGTFYWWGEG
jgi:hypothetical protein